MGLLGGFLLLLLLASPALGQLPSQDILALLAFKKGITHDPSGYITDSWNDESIDFNGCPASWNGIVCNGTSVAGVVLDGHGISGNADISVFANLTMLVKLSMANNNLSGSLPSNVGSLKSLKFMDISNNQFSGPIPEDIGNLRSLQNLSLAGNNFSGPLPDSIDGLMSLGTSSTEFTTVSTSMADLCFDVFGIAKEKKDPKSIKGNRELLDVLPSKRKHEDDSDSSSSDESSNDDQDELDLPTHKRRKKMEKQAYNEWKSSVLSSNKQTKPDPAKPRRQAQLNFKKPADIAVEVPSAAN